jgi:hypothetical protein
MLFAILYVIGRRTINDGSGFLEGILKTGEIIHSVDESQD